MNKTVVITGANRGIGLELCKTYVQRGYDTIGLCRQSSFELNASGAEVIEGIDVCAESLSQVLREKLSNRPIDILINNAGILRDESLGEINYETLQEQFFVNAVAPLKVAETLIPLLNRDAKIAFITSRMGSITDNNSGGRYGYRMSKAALNAAAVSIAKDVSAQGISVAILHPGYVQTDMVGGRGELSAETCANRLYDRIEALTLSSSGTFWHSNGEILPW